MKRFRTTELSNSRFESGNLRFITVKTPNLKGRGNICVFVPEGIRTDDLPIVVLLHGVYGSCWCWSMLGGAHHTAGRMIGEDRIPPAILAMPSDGLWGDGSGYLPHDGFSFDRWIVDDVVDAVRLNIPQAKSSTKTYIAGLSMGGFGALRLGARFPESFLGIAAHSSITQLSEMKLFVAEDLGAYRQTNPEEEDVFDLIRKTGDRLPRLRFDCGTDDELIEGNRLLHRQLTEAGIVHRYEEFPGGHAWTYWEEHLEDSLLFLLGE